MVQHGAIIAGTALLSLPWFWLECLARTQILALKTRAALELAWHVAKQEVLNQIPVAAWDGIINPKTPLPRHATSHPPSVKPASLVTCSGTERSGIPRMSQCQSGLIPLGVLIVVVILPFKR
jgi:hypothetical protein